ncbi:hypothetical protein ONZ45_g3505 [Pleurotus djamor]|nr:hypothetical protein ONZ45_g3505 [Pleurotus djamor]
MFFGAIAPDWRNLIPGYGVYHTIEGFVEWLGASHHNPAPYFSVGASSIEDGRIPIGAIGWTQRTISSRVFNITINDYVPFEQVVRRALGIYDLSVRQAYLRSQFDPIVVYWDQTAGYLTIDNRRLAIYRLSLPSHVTMPLRAVTREEAGRILATRINEGGRRQVTPEQAILRRYQSRTDGYSINITLPAEGTYPGGRITLSQIDYVQSPYMIMDNGHSYRHDEL